jgi:TM2 domain-containing membrane protein YozV
LRGLRVTFRPQGICGRGHGQQRANRRKVNNFNVSGQKIQQQGGLSSDTRAMMLFEANKKTAVVAYVLWFFLGLFGAHNFYLKRTGVAVTQLILTLTIVGMLITIVWALVDAFLIPGWVRNQNNLLAAQLGA